MYKFLPEQIENLEKQLDDENAKFNDFLELKKAHYSERGTGEGEETRVLFDNCLLEDSAMNVASLNDIREKLLNCKIVERSNSDEIRVGSSFEITFDGDDEKVTCTLIETRIPNDPMHFISISSPLGKAVIGKVQGDSFEYVVENSVISGKINEIIKTDENAKTKNIRK